MEQLADLRKHVQTSKLVTGTEEVKKMIKAGKIAKVFTAGNCPKESLENLRKICGTDCEIVELSIPNDELGIICKKPFSIAVVGILR